MSYKVGEDRNQIPLSLYYIDDYLAKDNICRYINEFCDSINLKERGFLYSSGEKTGSYDPKMLIKLLLYAEINHIDSPHRLEKEASRNIELMWLSSLLFPDESTYYNFKRKNLKQLKKAYIDFKKSIIL